MKHYPVETVINIREKKFPLCTKTDYFLFLSGTLLSGNTSNNRCSKGRRWRDGTFCFYTKSNIDTGRKAFFVAVVS